MSSIMSVAGVTFCGKAEEIFTKIYKIHGWGDRESLSGPGSSLEQTATIRSALPGLFEKFGIKRVNDASCGDFYWMKLVDLKGIEYRGFDIVGELIENNKKQYTAPNITFSQANMITDLLPIADVVICRDVFVHLPLKDALSALRNFKKSKIKYILATTFTRVNKNKDLSFEAHESKPVGMWRPLNLEIAPFNFPKPLALINENCTEGKGIFSDKCLGLWRLEDMNV